METFLETYYSIQAGDRTVWDGTEVFQDANYTYFIIYADQTEAIHMEQAALAYYYYENDYRNVAVPVPTLDGKWFSVYDDTPCMVWRANHRPVLPKGPHGERLAVFHMTGAAYPYEPETIFNYGQWKELWIEKLTAFENKINWEAHNHPNDYYRLLMDSMPYLIGLSENAIQYMQETESEQRFHDTDQATVVFGRYKNQLESSLVWGTEFAVDHPARDLAEYIRYQLLYAEDPLRDISLFLNDYQRIRPLSIFSWRVLLARLLYPVHFFDVIGRGFSADQYEGVHAELAELLQKQPMYEERLGFFFENAGINPEALQIPVLHWL
ncbi:spore coat protein CotS [Barrientosiimonas marina]|uniref:Spore coat protein YutH n=1 Tax=Lentibacillus kimchii TaxID=1542911 RepID=A0ABW2UQ88_9BACI